MHRGVVRGDLGDEHEHALEDLVEVDVLIEPLGQRVVHDGDRGHASHGLRERVPRLLGVRPPGLDPQQRRDGLQVVLHAVVDLADRRVLRDELLLLVTQLSDVAAEHDRAHPLAPVRNGIARSETVTPLPRCRSARAPDR